MKRKIELLSLSTRIRWIVSTFFFTFIGIYSLFTKKITFMLVYSLLFMIPLTIFALWCVVKAHIELNLKNNKFIIRNRNGFLDQMISLDQIESVFITHDYKVNNKIFTINFKYKNSGIIKKVVYTEYMHSIFYKKGSEKVFKIIYDWNFYILNKSNI